MQLYILTVLKYDILKLTYNEIKYLEYTHTHEKLTRNVYIFNIFTKLYKYLRYYSHY